ncbi:AAA family ATPase [Kribbella sp. NPDC056861]|uniref:AAA family ATPase n=1 Tax=Kribbella sp. NPDC056861 TaxID=3154857 RepID=UPI0034205245
MVDFADDFTGSAFSERSPFPGNAPGTREQERSPFPAPYVGNGEQPPLGLFYDVAAMFDGGLPDPPAPSLAHRSDGHALFYDGQTNMVFGDPESGKTWLCLAAGVEALNHGRRVLVLDMDHNGPEATIDRLTMLGAPVSALMDLDRFRYVEPDDASHLVAVIAAVVEWRPAVAIVDSVGELLPIFGYSSNSPDDFTAVNTRVLKPLAKAGAAVVGIDHLAKNTESRASGPTGTAAKRRAVGGVSIRVSCKDPFTPGRGGRAALTVHKDRHGGLRRWCPAPDGGEAYAGTFILTAEDDGSTSWHIAAPELGDRAPGAVARADLDALDRLDPPPSSVRDVKTRLNWRSDRAAEALREWRSRVPHTGVGERGTLTEPAPECPDCTRLQRINSAAICWRHQDQKAS